MDDALNRLGVFSAKIYIALYYARRTVPVAPGWLLFPFLLLMLLHPRLMIRLQYRSQGLTVPHFVTMQQWYFANAVTASLLIALVVLHWWAWQLSLKGEINE
jgi:hypothetical protein